MDYHSWEDDFQPVRSAAFPAFLAFPAFPACLACLAFLVANWEVGLEPSRGKCHEVDLAANLDASSADEPCEEMHDKMAKSCLNPVEPYCNPFRCCTVVEVE
jgi:hypothetical protein